MVIGALSRLTTLTGVGQGDQGGRDYRRAIASERRRANVLRTMTLTSFGSLLLAH